MTWKRIRLAVAVVLFVSWSIWLGVQAFTTANPVVVSRPQIFVAPVVVEATLTGTDTPSHLVKVVTVYRGKALIESQGKPGQEAIELEVRNLAEAKGWTGPGDYLLALQPVAGTSGWNVVAVPPSPGYQPSEPELLIYPATQSTRLQLQEALRLSGATQ